MDKKYLASVGLIKTWAQKEKDIMGALVLGSQVRKESPGDKWSDLDILLVVQDTSKYIDSEEWVNHFGNVVCISKEIINLSWINLIWHVKRVLYSDNRTLEFSIEPYNRIDDVLEMNKEIHSMGYELIYDGTHGDFTARVMKSIMNIGKTGPNTITESEFNTLIADLLFHIIYAFKKIKRGELWVAVSEINCCIKDKLLQIIEMHNYLVTKKTNVLMYEGRFIEKRMREDVKQKIEYCFTSYNEMAAIKALDYLIDITYALSMDISMESNYQVNQKQFELIRNIFDSMKQDVITDISTAST